MPSPLARRPFRGARALLLLAGALLPAPGAAAQDDVAALREAVERTRAQVERVYLDVQRDHARVRAADWGRAPFGRAFEDLLASLADGADALLRRVESEGVEAPLSPTSLRVVVAEAAGRAGDRPREAFVAAAREVFAAELPEDAWDARFLEVPQVRAFRAARDALAAEERRRAGKPEPKPAPPAPGADPGVLFERTRAWVGPWTGWTTDVPEKQNRRQQKALKAVYVDRHEVTCGEFAAFVAGLPPAARQAALPAGWTLGEDGTARFPDGRERHPVTGVTWRQAQAYAESRGSRLPTADEWDRAAAGGEKEARTFPWGTSDVGKTWSHLGVEPKGTFPVDAFPDDATPEGVVGMAGNASELTATYSDRADVPRTGPAKGRQVVVCGGNYASRASECATSWRWVLDADASAATVGFRCVTDEAEARKRHR